VAARDVHHALALGRLLHRLDRAVTARIEAALAGAVTVDQWRVLDLLADGEGHPMHVIAAHVGVPAPTLTKIVDRLVDAALVHRRVDEADRRRVLVLLTDAGRALHERLAGSVADTEREVVAALGENAATVRDLLQRLADRLG
jgi:DNA-binding MarR family transcriptional regulator